MRRLLVLACVVLTACACIPEFTGNQAGSRVAAVGDSITHELEPVLHETWDAERAVSVWGEPGARIDEAMPYVDEYVAAQPDALVINLGTNDAWDQRDLGAALADLDTIIAETSAISCVVFVTVSQWTNFSWVNSWALWFNLQLGAKAAAAGRLVANWSDVASQGVDVLTYDSVHPSFWGRLVLTQLIDEQLASCNV